MNKIRKKVWITKKNSKFVAVLLTICMTLSVFAGFAPISAAEQIPQTDETQESGALPEAIGGVTAEKQESIAEFEEQESAVLPDVGEEETEEYGYEDSAEEAEVSLQATNILADGVYSLQNAGSRFFASVNSLYLFTTTNPFFLNLSKATLDQYWRITYNSSAGGYIISSYQNNDLKLAYDSTKNEYSCDGGSFRVEIHKNEVGSLENSEQKSRGSRSKLLFEYQIHLE